MSAAVTSVLVLTQFQVTENPGSQPTGVNLTSFWNELDQLAQLSPTSTPAVSLFGIYKTTISGGGYTIDLTAFQGTNATLDGTGKKLIAIVIANPAASAGDVNVASGASNGYALAQPIKVKPGGFSIVYQAAELGVVDGTHKTLDLTATNGDTPELAFVLG